MIGNHIGSFSAGLPVVTSSTAVRLSETTRNSLGTVALPSRMTWICSSEAFSSAAT